MSNASAFFQIQADAAYARDGVSRAWQAVKQWASEQEHFSDALESTSVAPQNGTGAATVVSTQATRVYGVRVQSSGSSGFLVMYNAAAATVGVTAVHLGLPFGANEDVVVPFFRSTYDNVFGTGVTIGTLTTVAGTTALGTAVTKVTLLCDAIP